MPRVQRALLSLLHQVACGLEYLHGLGIIHGGADGVCRLANHVQRAVESTSSLASPPYLNRADLTPGNILLKADPATNSIVVKLAVSAGPTGRDNARRAVRRHNLAAACDGGACPRRTLGCRSGWTPRPRTSLALAPARRSTWRQRCVCALADGAC